MAVGMSRRALTFSALACAVLLTIVAGWQLMLYLHPAAWRVALWLPFAGLIHARELVYLCLWLVQFPTFAGVFVAASRRWPPAKVLVLLLVFYALCSVSAFFMVKAYPYSPNQVLR